MGLPKINNNHILIAGRIWTRNQNDTYRITLFVRLVVTECRKNPVKLRSLAVLVQRSVSRPLNRGSMKTRFHIDTGLLEGLTGRVWAAQRKPSHRMSPHADLELVSERAADLQSSVWIGIPDTTEGMPQQQVSWPCQREWDQAGKSKRKLLPCPFRWLAIRRRGPYWDDPSQSRKPVTGCPNCLDLSWFQVWLAVKMSRHTYSSPSFHLLQALREGAWLLGVFYLHLLIITPSIG